MDMSGYVEEDPEGDLKEERLFSFPKIYFNFSQRKGGRKTGR
jgi:hypothetical protein